MHYAFLTMLDAAFGGQACLVLRKVNLAPLEDLLPFRFIPSYMHEKIVELLYHFTTEVRDRSTVSIL